jgi:hypothetical protein
MRVSVYRTALVLALGFTAAAASAQAPGAVKKCYDVKDHYGKLHEDCRPRVQPRCHMAKNHYGKTVESCRKN